MLPRGGNPKPRLRHVETGDELEESTAVQPPIFRPKMPSIEITVEEEPVSISEVRSLQGVDEQEDETKTNVLPRMPKPGTGDPEDLAHEVDVLLALSDDDDD